MCRTVRGIMALAAFLLSPIEGGGSAGRSISTANRVNSCSSNASTGETVCVDNTTNVFELSGSSITKTLTSSSNQEAAFSGGYCYNCGVAIDALTNTAVISGGFSGGTSGDGLHFLNLATNTFATPYPSAYTVSENISVDPNRNLILSPDEDDVYDLFKINSDGSLSEFGNNLSSAVSEEDRIRRQKIAPPESLWQPRNSITRTASTSPISPRQRSPQEAREPGPLRGSRLTCSPPMTSSSPPAHAESRLPPELPTWASPRVQALGELFRRLPTAGDVRHWNAQLRRLGRRYHAQHA